MGVIYANAKSAEFEIDAIVSQEDEKRFLDAVYGKDGKSKREFHVPSFILSCTEMNTECAACDGITYRLRYKAYICKEGTIQPREFILPGFWPDLGARIST
jgi:hypothetical protein